jgi:hypothetical protein
MGRRDGELRKEIGRLRVQFWLCPIRGHSEGTWAPGELVTTVEWRRNIAYCLTPGCARTSADTDAQRDDLRTVTDDDRTWWLLGANLWTGTHLYAAPTAKAALAAYRRELTLAERRSVRDRLSAAGMHVVAGPVGTVDAFQHDLASCYAEELTRWKDWSLVVPFPCTPLQTVDVAAQLPPERAARIRAAVRGRYLTQEG